jgi:hypothetical protein
MKKILIISLALILACVGAWLWIFKRDKTDHLELIPKNCYIVGGVNLQSLHDKSNWNKLKDLPFFKNAIESNSAGMDGKIMEMLKHPLTSGVDLLTEPVLFVSNNEQKQPEIGLVFRLSSETNFTDNLTQMMEDEDLKVKEKDGYHYIEMAGGNDQTVLAWADKKGILLTEKGEKPSYEFNEFGEYIETKPTQKLDIYKRLKTLFAQTEEQSILANDQFGAERKKDHDVFIYADIDGLSKMLSQEAEKYKQMMAGYKDTYASIRLNFEPNRVAVYSQVYYKNGKPKNLPSALNEHGPESDFINNITDKKVYALLHVGLNMPIIKKMFLDDEKYTESIAQVAERMGMTSDELTSVFDGNIAFALTGMKEKEVTEMKYKYNMQTYQDEMVEEKTTKGIPVATLNVSVKNKEAMYKLLTYLNFTKEGLIWAKDNSNGINFYAAEYKNAFIFTSDFDYAKTVASGKPLGKMDDKSLGEQVAKYPSNLFISLELDKLPTTMSTELVKQMGPRQFKMIDKYMTMFKDLRGYSNNEVSELVLNLKEGDDNSLFRILEAAGKLEGTN